jgi:hypothetical protein
MPKSGSVGLLIPGRQIQRIKRLRLKGLRRWPELPPDCGAGFIGLWMDLPEFCCFDREVTKARASLTGCFH